MRTRLPSLLCATLWLALASRGLALERSAARLDDDRTDGWDAGLTCTVRYYNICTGWMWIFSGFEPSDRFGVSFHDACSPWGGWLVSSWHHIYSAAPAGYGFTGTIAVSAADREDCPAGVPLRSQPFLPIEGWNLYNWSGFVRVPFVIHVTLGAAPGTPLAVSADHPAAGPTGPVACGTCYPVTRRNHSYYYGPAGGCPGSPFYNDGVCDVQLLWDGEVFPNIVGVEPRSWGAIKSLYR